MNIKTLQDLCKQGVKVGMANPEGVCLGAYAIEILEKSLTKVELSQFKKNIVTYAESCDKTAAIVAFQTVDAVIGWSVFQYWNPDRIESVALPPHQIVRIGYIPIAVSVYTQNMEAAQLFVEYVNSPKAKMIFQKHHYFATKREAEDYIGGSRPVGGSYQISDGWTNEQK